MSRSRQPTGTVPRPAPAGEPPQPLVTLVAGAELRQRIPLLQALRQRGFRVAAVGPAQGLESAHLDLPFVPVHLARRVHPLADLRALRALTRAFEQLAPDVVHGFETKPALLTPLAGRRAGVAVRLRTVTGLGYLFSARSPTALALRPVFKALHRRAAAAASMTVFQNPEDRQDFLAWGMARPGQETLILGSGVDLAGLDQAADARTVAALRERLELGGGPVITMVSRLIRSKGVIEFLEAAAILHRRHPAWRFLLVGGREGEGRQAVPRRRLRRATPNVRVLGRRSDVPALLLASDLFVLPTAYREGIPRALLEAGALGLPLLASDVPGCREVVRDGWNGRLVPARAAGALAAAIEALVVDPILRATMGRRSREHVRGRFGLDAVADAYAALYQRLLAGAGAA